MIALLVAGLASVAFWQEKQRYRERASVATQNIALMLEQHISDVFDKVDVILRSGALHYQEEAARDHLTPAAINAYLVQQESLLSELDSLRILDKDGFVRFGRDVPATIPVNLSDREYFIRARDRADSGAIVIGPIFARITQKWVIVVARRLNAPDGSFAGVLYANLATSHFERPLASVALGPQGAATIRASDFALVHRVPNTRNAVGSREVSRELLENIGRNPDGGDYIASTALDGIERSNAYRKLQRYPFYVIVGQATDDYLGGWRQNVAILSGLAGLAILITSLAAWFVFRAHHRLSSDIDTRIRITGELESAMAERAHLNSELEIRAHEAEAANRAKSTFLANMSHELRTPMNAIMGLTELALRRPCDVRQRDLLGKVVHASQQLLSIINDILDLSRIEAERLALEKTEFRLGSLLENIVSLIGHKADEKGLKLNIDLPAEIKRMSLIGDPVRLEQILLNLAGNAVKFTETGSIDIRVRIAESDADSILCRFEVEDSGIGIADADQTRLFTAFEQADPSLTRKYGGTGLGLAISKRLVHLMGGDIGVASEAGRGSTFWFTLRLEQGNAALPASARDSATPLAEQFLKQRHAGRHILLAEDEPVNQEVSRSLLEDAGLKVDIANDGAEALDLAIWKDYDLILMDMQMPHMNGIESASAIRSLPGHPDIPIIAMTANAFEEDRQACLAAGMNDHIGKPVTAERFYAVILRWLEREPRSALKSADDRG